MEVRPYYHPTTTAIIDDSPDFLANLGLNLDSSLAYRIFESPLTALTALGSVDANAVGPERFFTMYEGREPPSCDHHVIDLNIARIYREVFNDKRFQRFSVVVVDYDMPEMDGLELCRRISQSPARKILLTGKADEKIAVQAFNEGIIDRYIPKQDPNLASVLREAISDMQTVYFANVERMMEDALAIGPLHFLRDPFFAELFRKLSADMNIVEFYLCSSPEAMLMIDAQGASTKLLVCNDAMMQLHYQVAFDNAAPPELLDALSKGSVVPYFWRSRGLYTPQYASSWKDYVFPSSECNGLQRYRYALAEEPHGLVQPPISTFQDHLKRIDEDSGRRHSA
jgi:CheY-like chemotaxis protein